MNVRNYRKCRRLFNYVMGPYLCPQCREEREAKFQEVKKFVQENRYADIPTVSEACNVEPSQINQWIREERLCFAEDSPIGIACERCGLTIKSGRFCEKCKAEMSNGFKSAITPQEPKPAQPSGQNRNANPKMRYLD